MRAGTSMAFIRHGATASNLAGRYLGLSDEPLSKEGADAVRAAKRRGSYPEARILFSSPMMRCIQTAGIIYPDLAPIIIPEWREIDFGEFEGKNYDELKGDPRYRRWIASGGTLPFPDGEGMEIFSRRCEAGFIKMAAHLQNADGNGAAAIVHGGIIMAIFSRHAGGGYYDYQAANGAGYRCVVRTGGGEPKIEDIMKLEAG